MVTPAHRECDRIDRVEFRAVWKITRMCDAHSSDRRREDAAL
jgi:hypothetical protein